MKKTVLLLLLVNFTIFSYSNQEENQYDAPQKITVTGKIENYDPSKPVTLIANRLGLGKEDILAKTDSSGNFIAIFESYIPLDVWISYKTNLLVLLHPSDSLFVRFNDKTAIDFGGDAAEINRNAKKFQQMYYSNEIYYDWDKKRKAVKEYDTDQYLQYLDTIQRKGKEIYDQFVAENNPDDETKKWAQLFIEDDYYTKVGWYAKDHRSANNMSWNNTWDVPKGFYDRLCNRIPIDSSMFISAYTLSNFSDNIFFGYVFDKLRDRATGSDGWIVMPGGSIFAPAEIFDSIKIFSTIEFVSDPLLLQIMLTHIFDQGFEKQNISTYEQFSDVVDRYIKAPFLSKPLQQKYIQTKLRIKNPQLYTETVLKKSSNLSVNQIVDDILQQNKGKIIYVDFWATWCAPCLAEMPNSRVLEHELKDEDIAFVYICLESEEKLWKANIDKFQLGGQHYLLSNKQSAEIRNLLEIGGIPFYLLIDKNGIIKEKGTDLRPSAVKNKILSL